MKWQVQVQVPAAVAEHSTEVDMYGLSPAANAGLGFPLDFAFNDSFMPASYLPILTSQLDPGVVPPVQDDFFEALAIVSQRPIYWVYGHSA